MKALKWLWNLLFKSRSLVWRTAKAIRLSIDWGPYFGFDFDFHLQFTPGYTIEFEPGDEVEESYSCGHDFRAGLTVGWIGLDLSIPNDDHPDDEFNAPMPKRYCAKCGLETETMMTGRCTGCRRPALACTCTKRDCCVDAGTADAAECCRAVGDKSDG